MHVGTCNAGDHVTKRCHVLEDPNAPPEDPLRTSHGHVRSACTYLHVPFTEKDAAKRLGAHWDGEGVGCRKAWYVPPSASPAPFLRWLPAQHAVHAPSPASRVPAPAPAPASARVAAIAELDDDEEEVEVAGMRTWEERNAELRKHAVPLDSDEEAEESSEGEVVKKGRASKRAKTDDMVKAEAAAAPVKAEAASAPVKAEAAAAVAAAASSFTSPLRATPADPTADTDEDEVEEVAEASHPAGTSSAVPNMSALAAMAKEARTATDETVASAATAAAAHAAAAAPSPAMPPSPATGSNLKQRAEQLASAFGLAPNAPLPEVAAVACEGLGVDPAGMHLAAQLNACYDQLYGVGP